MLVQPHFLGTCSCLGISYHTCAAPEARQLLEAARQAGFNKAEAAILHQAGSYHEAMLCLLRHDASGARALDYCEDSLGSLQGADLQAHQAFRAAVLQAMPGLAKVWEHSRWSTSTRDSLHDCMVAWDYLGHAHAQTWLQSAASPTQAAASWHVLPAKAAVHAAAAAALHACVYLLDLCTASALLQLQPAPYLRDSHENPEQC